MNHLSKTQKSLNPLVDKVEALMAYRLAHAWLIVKL